MKNFDIELFCKLAKLTFMDSSLYYNEHLLDLDHLEEIGVEEFDFDYSVKCFLFNFIEHILGEEAYKISEKEEYLFEPSVTIKSIANSKYGIIVSEEIICSDIGDYVELFDDFIYDLDTNYDNLYRKILLDTIEQMYIILSKDKEFLELITCFYDEYLFND